MVTNIVWPVVSSVLSSFVIGGIAAIYRSIKSTHTRLTKMEEHLRKQDERIARIEGRLSVN